MSTFDFQARTRIVFGVDRVDALGELAAGLGAKRALLVSDPGIIAAGHCERGQAALRQASIEVAVFHEFRENPSTLDVELGREVAADFRPDLIVGLGGGSSMDCAKGINFLLCCGGKMHDYWGVGKATADLLPMIAVPTTAGTGSEAQSFALISDAQTHVKMACGDPRAAFRIAVLDPRLTVTQPPRVTALTGVDAIAHAIETFVTTKRTPLSRAFSREAWRLLSRNLARVLQHPEDLEARGAMQLGACFAGLAIENSMLGAAHALANPLTATLGTVHGQAVGLMLPHVIRYNAETMADDYVELARELLDHEALASWSVEEGGGVETLCVFLQDTLRTAGLHWRLADCGVRPEQLDNLAASAATQWTGTFNPRPVTVDALRRLYEEAY